MNMFKPYEHFLKMLKYIFKSEMFSSHVISNLYEE